MPRVEHPAAPAAPGPEARPSAVIDDLQRLLYAGRCRMPADAPDWLAENSAFCGALTLAAYAEGGPPPAPEDLRCLAEAFRDVFASVAGEVPITHAIDNLLVTLGFRPYRGEKTALRRIAEESRARGRVDVRLAGLARGLTADAKA